MMTNMTDLQPQNYRELLDIIDALRSQGFNQHVDLQQIIVCGDQSAGKSSVLNAISGIELPTGDKLSTCFATELVLRRDSVNSKKVSINPDPNRIDAEKIELAKWHAEISLDSLDIDEIVKEAKAAMGISITNPFSNDTLRIELTGPTQPHLTLVDLPGLFRAGNTEPPREQAEMVRRMAETYMSRPRSIILAVVSAKTGYVLQEITEMARLADPEGLRTMGLITKPDTLYPGSGDELSWFKIVRNMDVKLKLGWHVVRNRSYEKTKSTSAERDRVETTFFSQGIWSSLKQSQYGIKSLTHRLSSILGEQILSQLPSMLQETEASRSNCASKLEQLGAPRENSKQQKDYLVDLSENFSTLMTAAVSGSYSNNPFFVNSNDDPEYRKRLRAVIQNRLVEFSNEMRENGESDKIRELDDDRGNYGILRDVYVAKVRRKIKFTKGCELPGLFNPTIVGELFIEQCQPWHFITARLSDDILQAVYKTTEIIVRHISTNEVTEKILSVINQGIENLKMNLNKTTNELLGIYDVMHAISYDPALTENVQAMQRDRKIKAVRRKIRDTFGDRHIEDPNNKIPINLAQIIDIFHDEIETDMEPFGSSLAVDYMQAYYKVALKRFTDDVSSLAIERCLISRLPFLFTPRSIFEMSEEQICDFAQESKETTDERVQLEGSIRVLQEALQKLKSLNSYRKTPERSIRTGQERESITVPEDQRMGTGDPTDDPIKDAHKDEQHDGHFAFVVNRQ